MKELTIEQKAKAYDEAVKEATIAHKDEDKHLKATLERIFPELKESDDEKIRKELISFVNNDGWRFIKLTKEEKEAWIAWLKKQGENKSADKVKPKFKVGDWCIDNEDGTIFQIVKALDNTYTYRTNEGKEYSCTHYSLENDARLLTIQDAKNCDVLVSSNGALSIIASEKKIN